MTSHASCTHPATKAARTACRKGAFGSEKRIKPNTDAKVTYIGQPRVDQATSEKRRGAARKAAQAEIRRLNDERIKLANDKRTKATQAMAATQQRQSKTACFECGGKAGWVDTTNDQPVCMKHVDYDHCKIIPL